MVGRRETKFLVDEATAAQLVELAEPYLVPDDHGRSGAYTVTSLYLDTLGWESVRESHEGLHTRCKLRLRAYDLSPGAPVWAEVKRRHGGIVLKSRVRIDQQLAARLCDPRDAATEPEEFVYEATMRGAVPRLWVRYQRQAFTSAFGDRTRLTVDRNVEVCDPARGWTPPTSGWRKVEIEPPVIVEMKYDQAFPRWMQHLAHFLGLQRQSVSKYVLGATPRLDDPWARLDGRTAWIAI